MNFLDHYGVLRRWLSGNRSLSVNFVIPWRYFTRSVIIMDSLSTLLVEPDCTAEITCRGDIKITIGQGRRTEVTTDLDNILLSIFSHRFMSIAEQMGRYVYV